MWHKNHQKCSCQNDIIQWLLQMMKISQGGPVILYLNSFIIPKNTLVSHSVKQFFLLQAILIKYTYFSWLRDCLSFFAWDERLLDQFFIVRYFLNVSHCCFLDLLKFFKASLQYFLSYFDFKNLIFFGKMSIRLMTVRLMSVCLTDGLPTNVSSLNDCAPQG